jgi:ribosomal protein L37AE/L43A
MTDPFDTEGVECPECGVEAPKRQVQNIGVCEKCSIDGVVNPDSAGETMNPETNVIDKWKMGHH